MNAGQTDVTVPAVGEVYQVAWCASLVSVYPRDIFTDWSPLERMIGSCVDTDCPHADLSGKMGRATVVSNKDVQPLQQGAKLVELSFSANVVFRASQSEPVAGGLSFFLITLGANEDQFHFVELNQPIAMPTKTKPSDLH